jgi:hypothetical protein
MPFLATLMEERQIDTVRPPHVADGGIATGLDDPDRGRAVLQKTDDNPLA